MFHPAKRRNEMNIAHIRQMNIRTVRHIEDVHL